MGHTPSTAGTFRKKFQKNSGKTPEALSERFLEFPSRVQLGSPKPYNSRHMRLPEHFQNSLPPSTAGDASFFRSGSGEGLSEPITEFPAVLGVFLSFDTPPLHQRGALRVKSYRDARVVFASRDRIADPHRTQVYRAFFGVKKERLSQAHQAQRAPMPGLIATLSHHCCMIIAQIVTNVWAFRVLVMFIQKFRRVTIRGAQPSARLSEEVCLSEGSAGVFQRALRGSFRGLCGGLRGSAGVRGIFRGFPGVVTRCL